MTESFSTQEPPALECLGLRKRFGAVRAVDDVSLRVRAGELLALLGPSGCGKTTTLRLIAGFESADGGSVRVGDRVVLDEGTWLPPEERRVGMVFQDYALFPHLTVAGNVRYGLLGPGGGLPGPAGGLTGPNAGTGDAPGRTGVGRLRGWLRRWAGARWAQRPARLGTDAGVAARVGEALALVSLAHMGERYPHELSGGEAQRVALARALAPRPALILLDEPFSNLDTGLRASVRAEVRAILQRAGAAAVFVTHDQEEAFSLADRVAVMWQGRIAQVGTGPRIYQEPATRAVASFVGEADFLPGEAGAEGVRTEIGLVAARDGNARGRVDVMLRPESLRVETADAPAEAGVAAGAAGEVVTHEYYGHDQMISVRLGTGRVVRVRLGPDAVYRPGDRVRVRAGGAAVVFAGEAEGSGGAGDSGPRSAPTWSSEGSL